MPRSMQRILLSLVALVVAAAALHEFADYLASRHYYPGAPAADYPPPADDLQARQQDLDYFRSYLVLDRSYTDASRRRAEAILEAAAESLDAMSDAGFQLSIARAVAAADNGHSNIWLGRFSRAHGRVPLQFYWFADGVYVVRARQDQADLLGARLLAVGDTPLADAAPRLREFAGGTLEAFRAYQGPVLLGLPAAHYAAGLTESESRTRLAFQLPDGTLLVRELDAEPLPEEAPLYWSYAYLYESLPEAEAEPWFGLASQVASLPLYLQEPGRQFRTASLPGSGLYVQYRANRGDEIEVFGERVRERVQADQPAYLVLDQRFNGGGDYTLTARLMQDLPNLLGSAPVYVVTGPATFSAGINSVAFVRANGGSRVHILGERIGDRERMFGETNDFELPNSKLGMTFNTGLHDVENGCPPFPQCYYRNYFYDVAVGKLDPDFPIATGYGDYMAGVDPVLDFVLAKHAPR